MTWTDLSAAFSYGSTLTSTQMQQLRDNLAALAAGDAGAPLIQAAAIDTGAVGASEIAASAVHQSELNTSTETAVGGLIATTHVLSGGSYEFYPQLKFASGSGTDGAGIANIYNGTLAGLNRSTSYQTVVTLDCSGVSSDITLQFRYVAASPPYDLGEGPVPLFVWLIRDKASGDIQSMHISRTPPWVYNGPTSIKPDYYDKQGRPIKRIWVPDGARSEKVIAKAARLSTREKEALRGTWELREVSNELKNADADLIPSPFYCNDLTGREVVLLDPLSPDLWRLAELHEAGDDIADIIRNELIINAAPLNRMVPDGVVANGFKWRLTA